MKLLGTILLLPISFCSATPKYFPYNFWLFFFNATVKPPTYSIQNLFPLGGNTQPQWFALTPLSMLDKRIRQHELRVSQYNNNPTWRSLHSQIEISAVIAQYCYTENHPLFSLQNRFSLFKSSKYQVRPDISFLCNSEETLIKLLWQSVL